MRRFCAACYSDMGRRVRLYKWENVAMNRDIQQMTRFLRNVRLRSKCVASHRLSVRRKTPPPCRGGGPKGRRGFPPTCHSARETKRPLWPPQGKQKGRYDPVGVRPPPPLRGSSPCEAGQFCHPHGEKRVVTPPPYGEQKGRYAPIIRRDSFAIRMVKKESLRPRRMESRRGVTHP